MVQVIWGRRALADLAAIQRHIHQFRPLAAQRMAQRLKLAGASLGEQSERGRAFGGYRELTTVSPYVIRYKVRRDRVDIIRIKHAAQRL